MFKQETNNELTIVQNKMIYAVCDDFVKKELKRIPEDIDKVHSQIHNLCIFNLNIINRPKRYEALKNILISTTHQGLALRLKLLIREMYARFGINIVSEYIRQIEYALNNESNFPFKQYQKLKKEFQHIWIIPYLQMVYNNQL